MKKALMTTMLVIIILFQLFDQITVSASSLLDELEKNEKEQQERQADLEKKRNDLESEKKEIQSAYDQTLANLEGADESLEEALKKVQEIEVQKAEIELEISELENEMDGKENEIARIQLNLVEVEQEQELANEKAKERIRVLYEYGEVGFVEVLFESKDLVEMFNRLEYINRLVDADNEIFDSLDDYEDEILLKQAEVEVEQATLTSLSEALESENEALQVMVEAKNLEVLNAKKYIAIQEEEQENLEASISQQEALEAEMERDRQAIDAELAKILEQKAAELQRISGFDYSGGIMQWPLPGHYYISSVFGNRFHPIDKVWRNHDGIDIPAPAGTPIQAAESGEVIISKYGTGYGNYVAIAHGNGYITLYAHCSQRLVEVGDAVATGQVIAKVGSTGWSTGNHLHFAVKKDDQWLNPMDFVK